MYYSPIMPRPSKNTKPKYNKLALMLKHQNHEANQLRKTCMPKPDSMPSLKIAREYGELLNVYIRNHMNRRVSVIEELKFKLDYDRNHYLTLMEKYSSIIRSKPHFNEFIEALRLYNDVKVKYDRIKM